MDKITVKEAINQGYRYYGQNKGEFQHLNSIDNMNDCDFECGPVYLAEKEAYYTPGISSKDITNALADIVSCQSHDETGDDTDDVYDIVKALNFTVTASLINAALVHKKYYKLTNIQLIP